MGVFDTIAGLPIHPLVVHAVVVLLPLACLATIAVAVRPSWRRFAPALAVLNAAVMVAAFVAVQSGESLEHRVEQFSEPAGLHDHAEWGERLMFLAAALFIGALVIWVDPHADGAGLGGRDRGRGRRGRHHGPDRSGRAQRRHHGLEGHRLQHQGPVTPGRAAP